MPNSRLSSASFLRHLRTELRFAFDAFDPRIPAFHLRRFCVICGQNCVSPLTRSTLEFPPFMCVVSASPADRSLLPYLSISGSPREALSLHHRRTGSASSGRQYIAITSSQVKSSSNRLRPAIPSRVEAPEQPPQLLSQIRAIRPGARVEQPTRRDSCQHNVVLSAN
jgi:hypothetical protein